MKQFNPGSFLENPIQKESGWRWKAGLVSLIIWTAIFWMSIQSYMDYNAVQTQVEQSLSNLADQIIRRLEDRSKIAQLLAGVIHYELIGKTQNSSRQLIDSRLVDIQQRFSGSLPGNEIAIYNPSGTLLGCTDNSLFQNYPAFPRLINKIEKLSDSRSIIYDLINLRSDENALTLVHAEKDESGHLIAAVIFVFPTSILNNAFNIRQLGPDGLVVLRDSDNRVVKRHPPAPALTNNDLTNKRDLIPTGGLPGTYFVTSPIDNVTRLVAQRIFKMVLAEEQMTLLVGVAKDYYLSPWIKNLSINIGISLMLLIGWILDLTSRMRGAKKTRQLEKISFALQTLIDKLPVSLALVETENGHILHSNPALLSYFGSLAAEDESITHLFIETLKWRDVLTLNNTTMEVMTRRGKSFMRISCNNIGDMGFLKQECSLVAFVDVTESHLREQKLQTQATTDTLTGLSNRRFFNTAAEEAIINATNTHKPLCVLSLDIDHFKRVNDTFGHDAGDIVLTLVAKLFQGSLNPYDIPARLGGEEFAALLPNTSIEQAHKVAERIRKVIASTPILINDSQTITVTVSIGIAPFKNTDEDIELALKRADEALYQAKDKGRNQVVCSK